jgi:hypothetical protein
MVSLKRVAIAAMMQVLAKRNHGITCGEELERGAAIEAQQIPCHRPEARADQIAAAAQEGGGVDGRILGLSAAQRHAERHVREFRFDAKMLEQRNEVRVGRVVEDDEAGIDWRWAETCIHHHRVRMAPEAIVLFVNDDVVLLAQQPRRRHSGYARADDGDTLPGRVSEGGESHRTFPLQRAQRRLVTVQVRAARGCGSH